MPWQKWFLKAALELHPEEVDEVGDPVFRFRKVILLVGRQNGKSTVMQALTLWRMFVDRTSLVIGTAQDLEVAESLWAESVEMAEESDDLGPEIAKIEKGAGKKRLVLRSGETYKVKAASRRGGRGLSGELVLLDELREHQTWDAWSAVTKTTNAKARAQIYGISNAGDATSIVLRYLRKMAHADLGDPDGINRNETASDLIEDDDEVDDSGLGIFEWSAPPECGKWDRDAWAQSNPSLGYRVRESTLASDAKTDPEWVFRTEVLCQWTDGTLEGVFPPGSWEACLDEESKIAPGEKIALSVDVSYDRSYTSIAVAGRRGDGLIHVGIIADRAGTDWVLPWLQSDEAPDHCGVAIQMNGAPASSLADSIAAAGIEVVEWQGSDLTRSAGNMYDFVSGGHIRHRTQQLLDVAAATAVTKNLADAWWWDRRNSPTDIAPLVAATGAVWVIQPKPIATKTPQIHEWPDELLEAM